MSKQANPRIIGGFVVGAIFLAVVAVLSFGSGEFLAEKVKYVLFFDGTMSGLAPGSPVLFRGAQIGSVTEVVVLYDTQTHEVRIPVYIEIDRDSIQFVGGARPAPGAGNELLIQQGLRAKLVSQSMITGQLAILLDFFPDTPAKLVGADPSVPEFPTAPSFQEQLDDLFKSMQKLPIGDLIADLRNAIQGLNELVRSPEIKQAISTLDATLLDFQKLAQNVDGQIGVMGPNLNDTLTDVRQLVNNLNGKVDPLTQSLQDTLATGRSALEQATQTLASAQGVVAADAPTMQLLNNALAELSDALRSIRVLADYLEQHPDAVLSGKRQPGG